MGLVEKKTLYEEIKRHPLLHEAEQCAVLAIVRDAPEVGQWRTDNPPSEGEYIVTIQNAQSATTLHYSEEQNEWFDENGEAYNVAAWMLLPAAYKETA